MNNKTPLVLGIVAVVLLLCVCCAVVAAFFIFQNKDDFKVENNLNGTIDYGTENLKENEIYLKFKENYLTKSEEIDSEWRSKEDSCNTEDEYDALMDKEYLKNEIAPLKTQVEDLVESEWNCYKELRNFELDTHTALLDQVNEVNCSGVETSDDCYKFQTDLAEIVRLQKELFNIIDVDYTRLKNLELCYLVAFEANYDAEQSVVDAAYTECDESYPNNDEEIQGLKDEYSALYDSLLSMAQ